MYEKTCFKDRKSETINITKNKCLERSNRDLFNPRI